jgi:hypothetical protein
LCLTGVASTESPSDATPESSPVMGRDNTRKALGKRECQEQKRQWQQRQRPSLSRTLSRREPKSTQICLQLSSRISESGIMSDRMSQNQVSDYNNKTEMRARFILIVQDPYGRPVSSKPRLARVSCSDLCE